MNSEEFDRVLADALERPSERKRIIDSAGLGDEARQELMSLLRIADQVWLSGHGAPLLSEDPAAAMLGLVPDSACRLDAPSLKRQRMRAKLSVGELASRLKRRGWQYESSDLFRWENRTAADVPPAVVQAISEILGSTVDSLIASAATSGLPQYLESARLSTRFGDLVTRWSEALNVSREVATAALESRMLATVHRGSEPDTEQVLRSLDALVFAVEHRDSSGGRDES